MATFPGLWHTICGTGEQTWEHHVEGDHNALADISVGYLNVLDFSGISCVPLGMYNPLGAASDSLHSRDIGESALPGVSHSCLRRE